jgi:N-hydroxyarylamine O-acetyltransferase
VRLDLASIQHKLVRAARRLLLRARDAFRRGARTTGFSPGSTFRASRWPHAQHLAAGAHVSTVPVGDKWFVVDVGFGALAPQFPVPLLDAAKRRPDHATQWMARDGSLWVLRAKSEGRAVDAWVSTLEPDNPIDFEMANHYIATHPASPFVNRMLLCALGAEGLVTVMNRDATVWHGNVPHATRLPNRAALRRLLAQRFGFDLPEIEGLRVPSIVEWV